MKLNAKSVLLIFLFLAVCYNAKAQQIFSTITDYKVYYGWAHHYPQDWIILRSFKNNNKPYYLLINPQTLVTKIDAPSFYQVKPMTFDAVRRLFSSSPYVKALDKAEKQDVNIQDAGIESGLPEQIGVSLTADLCPSHRPLDRRIFTAIISEFSKVEHPVPIALSITGIWMEQHQQDLAWLKGLQRQGYIYITWINHSFNHKVSATLPLKHNFLLEAGTDIYYEVTETEKAMLKNGLLPSAFFRFPGLISDQQLVTTISNFGLITIGTDAWLAKGEQAENGSIVLIHGNGNEPVGVADFIKLLQSKKRSIAGKQWLLYDLRDSVDQEFEQK